MFKVINLSGNYGDIGYAHGQSLKDRIHKTIDYYLGLFDLPHDVLKNISDKYQRVIFNEAKCYCDEIEAIAEGADVEPWYIYALNARSEILNIKAAECTSLYFKSARLLGQNWDWACYFEPLITVINIKYNNGHEITTLTEPGMLAKIGLNSAGIGVCLNILQSEISSFGIPVHICLRMALDSHDFQSAEQKLTTAAKGKASHILLADDQGNCSGLEFKDRELFRLKPTDGYLVHTNHYLAVEDNNASIPATFERLKTARSLASQLDDVTQEDLMAILMDNNCGEYSILQGYQYIKEFKDKVGTVATVIMDLPTRALFLRLGSSPDNNFKKIVIGKVKT